MKHFRQEQTNNNISNKRDFEARQNLFGFFDLLLKIDMRNNPKKHKDKNLNNQLNKPKC